MTIKKDSDDVRVSVTNPGEPIPEEDREVIWERYQRSQHHGGRLEEFITLYFMPILLRRLPSRD